MTYFFISENTFQEEFTADEKIKLYNAIGYEENHSDITLPKDVRFIKERKNVESIFSQH